MDSQYGMECNSPVKGFIDEPNFSGSVGTAYTSVEFIGSGPFYYHHYNKGQGGMASTGSRFRPLMRDAMGILLWVPVGVFFTRHIYSFASITGSSMQPTFNPDLAHSPFHHDVVLLQRWSISLHQFKRGDVVTLYSPQNPDLLTTKRIIALEGDLVTPLPPSGPTPVRIPAGHCWVEGDSRFNTKDSNTYGPIPLGLINSKVSHVIWPRERIGKVQNSLGKAKGRVRRFAGSLV